MEERTEGELNLVEAADTSEMDGKYLTFWTDSQLFGLPIADVVQIVGVQNITPVPEFPSYAKGIINLRGSIIPVIDVRLRFGKMEIDYDEHTCIIISNIRGRLIGFLVDSVDEVTDIPDEEISQPPTLAGSGTTYLTGIGKKEDKVILLLNVSRLMEDEEMDLLASMM